MTVRQRALLKIVLGPWIGARPTFDEWCAAVDELYGNQH